jgi:hypothetical protein
MRVGVITDIASTPIARAAGADHVEPAIVGNLVHEVARGRWEATPEVPATIPEADRAPSSAILFPGGMRVSDPAVPEEETADYLEHLNRVGLAEAAQSMDRMAQIVREL